MTTRIFCAVASLLSILFGDHVNGPDYAFLTNKNYEFKGDQKNIKFTLMANLVVLVLVQVKIEVYKKSVDESHRIIDSEENPESNKEYNKRTVRIILGIIFLTLLMTLVWAFQKDDMKGRLRIIVAYNFILTNVLPIVLIKRNQNMYDFCKHQFQIFGQKIFLPQWSTDIHPNLISRSVIDIESNLPSNATGNHKNVENPGPFYLEHI